ncbi:unnamed protein product [Chrysodeixis includens]|uniref:Uncharacterized protein n=1 Tax=Chrysodeixis includens TaxID=689277 RepID=A0A9N8Q0C2_CHRIL|nr:unnamed protein product [Chrysodeixis includens]
MDINKEWVEDISPPATRRETLEHGQLQLHYIIIWHIATFVIVASCDVETPSAVAVRRPSIPAKHGKYSASLHSLPNHNLFYTARSTPALVVEATELINFDNSFDYSAI